MSDIDEAEALLAVIGMTPIISHEVEQVSQAQWLRARDLEFEINKRARDLVLGNLADHAPTPPRAPYMRTLRDLTTAYNPAQVEAMVEHLPPELADSRGEFLMLAQKAFSFLGSQLPRQAQAGAAGWTQLKPPERLFDRFLSLMLVLDDPLEALGLAGTGRLLSSQVAALMVVMPTVLAHMRQSVARELRAERALDPTFKPPYHADVGIQRLLGTDLTNPALKQLLAQPPPQPAAQPQAGQDKGAPLNLQLMTHAQRTENL